jgi:N-acetylmuramoyl-L-alanine amidase
MRPIDDSAAQARERIMRALLAALLIYLALGMLACSASPDDSGAFLINTAARRPLDTPSPVAQSAGSPGLNAPSQTRIARGGNGSTQVTASGQVPVLAYIDPGHGGVDVGTQGTTPDGQTIFEKTISLAIATRVAQILRQNGIGTVLSRSADSLPESVPADYTGDGHLLTPEGVLHDLQRRVDRANASGAIVLLSIHLNAFSDPAVGGSETFYDADRTFADDNHRFATLVQTSVVAAMRESGYASIDRGVTDDSSLQSDGFGTLGVPYGHLILLGPAVPGKLRPSQMPGALSEPLFLSNPSEAGMAIQPGTQEALAKAYANAIEQFLRN